VPEAESVGDARGDRDHVLERAAHLHADHVVRAVDAHAHVAEGELRRVRVLLIVTGDQHRSRIADRDLARKTGAAQVGELRVQARGQRAL
jgi:hypothetical protein